jgi:SAM-dependent methyltransferase
MQSHVHDPTVISAIRNWWREQRQETGFSATSRKLLAIVFEFLRDSLPEGKRQRYGDVDFDWEFRVDTTSATVSWRERFIGSLSSPYQPIEPALFREIMNSLVINFPQFTFIDIGSGKGRALLMASEYEFRCVLGIELLPKFNQVAQENIRRFSPTTAKGAPIEVICGDATQFSFPAEPSVVLLNNPLRKSGLRKIIGNLEQSLREVPRSVFLVYANPIWEQILSNSSQFQKIAGTHQYSVFATPGVSASREKFRS